MENQKFQYGPSIVQLLQARGLSVREHLLPLQARIALFDAQGGDLSLTGRYLTGWVAGLSGPDWNEAEGGGAWCGAVESVLGQPPFLPAALVVDGDPVERRFAATVLARAGMTVNAVDHSDGAWLSNIIRYDFILIDYEWSTGRGAALAEDIRVGLGPNVKTYILGSSSNRAEKECMAAGMDSFLLKPIDLATLKMRALRVASGTPVSSVP